jgi:hypothetical protein
VLLFASLHGSVSMSSACWGQLKVNAAGAAEVAAAVAGAGAGGEILGLRVAQEAGAVSSCC